MWGIIGKLLGTEATINKGIDVISSGLDKLIYTEEEKAGDASIERAKARGMLIKWMDATQGQNIARRLLALIISSVWLFMYILSAGLDLSVVWVNQELVDNIVKSADTIGARATQMNGAMMLILGFYFAAPHLGKIIPVAMKRFGNTEDK